MLHAIPYTRLHTLAARKTQRPFWMRSVALALVLREVYRFLLTLRLWAYRWGWLRSNKLPTPVISLGALTVGGAGKTPAMDWLLGLAQRKGLRVACLTRGHGRDYAGGIVRARLCEERAFVHPQILGDEGVMLAQHHPQVAFYAAQDRFRAGLLACTWDAPTLFVLEDGFQHLALQRSLNVLIVDTHHGFGAGQLFPHGCLREPVKQAARADVVLFRCADAQGTAARELWASLPGVGPAGDRPMFRCAYQPHALLRLDGSNSIAPTAFVGEPVGAACGIALPEKFLETLRTLGMQITETCIFRDHEPFCAQALARLEEHLKASAPRPWIVTEKDAVKLAGRIQDVERVWVLAMKLVPEPACEEFFSAFLAASSPMLENGRQTH